MLCVEAVKGNRASLEEDASGDVKRFFDAAGGAAGRYCLMTTPMAVTPTPSQPCVVILSIPNAAALMKMEVN